jgi:formylglycine-generating enzyme required for sulfatase activity
VDRLAHGEEESLDEREGRREEHAVAALDELAAKEGIAQVSGLIWEWLSPLRMLLQSLDSVSPEFGMVTSSQIPTLGGPRTPASGSSVGRRLCVWGGHDWL